MARFTFDEAVVFLSNGRGEVARREGWKYVDVIHMDGEKFLRGDDEVVELSAEDRASDDWVVYRQA